MEVAFQHHRRSSDIQCRGGWVGLRADLDEYGEEKNLSRPLRFEPRTVQAITIRCIDYSNPCPNDCLAIENMRASGDGVFH